MDSCFPPLAALSLGPSKAPPKGPKGHGPPFGLHAPPPTSPPGLSATTDHAEALGKMNILQDLDLYYIRQIAHNLKVRQSGPGWTTELQ